ncbi:extracellular solute-binding protein [Lederbergia lenta]|uniref:Sugar ABC transporter substrate-binding protein n=1 Tax=Lederbergia lenta TaxID=1467 RepID=A0A2X4VP49_LEDLE|nr:extracellular solute-binding protein [Lederbergia lenta]MCM3110896.1 extracellular solute-binding protein [Lederbergia lenta]MEC2325708.1 extracellular solute-binding protein [Lederbergia lenta]SQI53896.1 sugar ABC transporter substrate-binding protein [Lederbergia lenta]
MKKLTLTSLTLLLVVVLFLSGCVPSKKSTSSENSDPNGPVEVTIFTPKFSDDEDFSENEFTKMVEEKFNMKINWEYVNQDAAKEKRQLSLASGDYPDAYMLVTWLDNISKVDAQKYGKEGVFLPLNDLIKDQAPNIQKAMEDLPYLEKGMTAPDGNIYGLPLVNECYHCSVSGKMWINTEWLNNLNLEMPKTAEEFKEVMKAFKNDDPNGNGKKDEIPLSGETPKVGGNPIQFLMGAFIPNNGIDYINVNEGKLSLGAMQPEWKEGLKYVHSLYEEGLIDNGAFTQNSEAFKQLGTPEGDAILGAAAGQHSAIFVDLQSEHSKSYHVVPPLKGPNGAQYTSSNYGNVNNFAFAITDKAKGEKAEALIKLADYLYSEEGTIATTRGKEGVHWKKGDPEDIDLNGQQAKLVQIPQDPNLTDEEKDAMKYGWGERGPLGLTRTIRDYTAADIDEWSPEGFERRLFNATKKYDGFQPEEQFNFEAAWVDPEEAEEVALLKININKYIEEHMVQFATGSENIDKDWDNYIDGFKTLQVDRYLEIYQKAYDLGK